jgi:SAM-dependent methyltransferase
VRDRRRVYSGESPDVALPPFPIAGRRVLDVGCRDGATLMHSAYASAGERCGIDVDAAEICKGARAHPELKLCVARAEELPYPDAHFDVVISNVTLPYTDIRRALAEIHRVMKPHGHLLVTLHDWRHQALFLWDAVKLRAAKRCLDHTYICMATAAYLVTGRVPVRPFGGMRGTRETFQTAGALKRDLGRFSQVAFDRTQRHFIVTARKR